MTQSKTPVTSLTKQALGEKMDKLNRTESWLLGEYERGRISTVNKIKGKARGQSAPYWKLTQMLPRGKFCSFHVLNVH